MRNASNSLESRQSPTRADGSPPLDGTCTVSFLSILPQVAYSHPFVEQEHLCRRNPITSSPFRVTESGRRFCGLPSKFCDSQASFFKSISGSKRFPAEAITMSSTRPSGLRVRLKNAKPLMPSYLGPLGIKLTGKPSSLNPASPILRHSWQDMRR